MKRGFISIVILIIFVFSLAGCKSESRLPEGFKLPTEPPSADTLPMTPPR